MKAITKLEGAALSETQRRNVLSRYLNRDTKDSPWSATARAIVGKGPATETDQQWVNNRFWTNEPIPTFVELLRKDGE